MLKRVVPFFVFPRTRIATTRAVSARVCTSATTTATATDSVTRTQVQQCTMNMRTLHQRQFTTVSINSFVTSMPVCANAVSAVKEHPYSAAGELTAEDIATIKSTVPFLAEHGLTLTTRFYEILFNNYPSLHNVFNVVHQKTGMQPKALAAAVHAYAANIDNLSALGPAVAVIAHKHASLSVLPEHYPVVGTNLLIALTELLTSAKVPEEAIKKIIGAWGKAYGQLAKILIEAEECLYETAASQVGGWRGWRKFVLEKRVPEANGVVSFYFKSKDGKPIPTYLPGQYTCIKMKPKDGEYNALRQYSLSSAPNSDHFRITVKAEPGNDSVGESQGSKRCPFAKGTMSNLLHNDVKVGDEVELAPPFGAFSLDLNSTSPVVILAGGVGITPFVSMIEGALRCNSQTSACPVSSGNSDGANIKPRQVTLIHAVRDGSHHIMKQWKQSLSKKLPADLFQTITYYETPSEADKKNEQGAFQTGRVDLLNMDNARIFDKDTDYYICGPLPFMLEQLSVLRKKGIPEERLHAEIFGSGAL